MNKTELIAAVAEKAGLTKKDVEKAVAALLETVKGEVAKKGKVQLIGFGTFEARTRNARTGKNPRTNEPIKIPLLTKYIGHQPLISGSRYTIHFIE